MNFSTIELEELYRAVELAIRQEIESTSDDTRRISELAIIEDKISKELSKRARLEMSTD